MEDKKDIGQAFREKLDSLNRQPGDALWDSISKDLDKKKKRKFPLFWFSILSFSVLAIIGLVYFASNFSGNNNSGLTKQESLQNDIPANHSTTGIQNPVENKNTSKASSANGVTDHQNGADKRTDATNSKGTNSASANSASTAKVKSDDKKGSNTGKAIFEAGAGSKTGRNKNNATANKGRKQTISNKGETASTDNLKIAKTTNKSKKRSTPLYNPKNKAVVASGNGNTESGFATASSSKRSRKKTATQSNARVQKSITESEKQPINAPGETSATAFVSTGAEAANREGAPAMVSDTLSENAFIPKDSLITELPKEEVAEEKKDEKKKDSLVPQVFKRFSVFAYGGPSFYNFPNRTIVTDSTTSNITTKSATRFGVLLGYRLNSKLSIRTGVSIYKMKQSANKIKLNYTMSGGSATNPELIPNDDFEWIDYKQPFGTNSGQIISNLGENYQAIINIDRDLSYLEIPLEIGYNLFDRKFGVDVFGGGSMLLLTKNQVSAYNEKGRMYLGKWNAAATTSFTGALGLRLHYNLNPSLQLNAEPVLNYYLNTYNDSKPSSFTVRVGLQYNFDIGAKKK